MEMKREFLRQQVIARLKEQARDHYYKMNRNSDMSCGRRLGDFIRGTNEVQHHDEYMRCYRRLRRIDPTCPEMRV